MLKGNEVIVDSVGITDKVPRLIDLRRRQQAVNLQVFTTPQQPLVDQDDNEVDIDDAEEFLRNKVREDQKRPG